MYFYYASHQFTTEDSKIYFTLTLMQDGKAKAWADRQYIKYMWDSSTNAPRPTPVFPSWADFWSGLAAEFGDPRIQEHALAQLKDLRQGKDTAREYFATMDRLRAEAGMSDKSYDPTFIFDVKNRLDRQLVTELTKRENPPVTYDQWKESAIRLDDRIRALEQQQREERRMQGYHHYSQRPPPQKPPQPSQSKPLPQGEPMELDRSKRSGVCFKCGKAGHWAGKCPEGAKAAKTFVRGLRPADRYLLAREMEELKESEFFDADADNFDEPDYDHFLLAGQ